MTLKLQEVAYHRNGVHGAGFYVVRFHERGNGNMLGIVFEEEGNIAVLNTDLLADGNIKFGENSWRYEDYDVWLRKVVAEYVNQPQRAE